MKRTLRIFCCMLIAMCFYQLSFAQQLNVTGKIINQKNNEPLAGATVSIKGTKTTVAADKFGNFDINVSNLNAVLGYTIGYYKRNYGRKSW
jgi:putative cell wall-binding protein